RGRRPPARGGGRAAARPAGAAPRCSGGESEMAGSAATLPPPPVNPETKPFWDAAAQGRFLIKRCTACDEPHWYPRALCPFCGSERTEWMEASGHGTIYAYSVFRRAQIPYAIAYVTLAEGPTMMTNIVDC